MLINCVWALRNVAKERRLSMGLLPIMMAKAVHDKQCGKRTDMVRGMEDFAEVIAMLFCILLGVGIPAGIVVGILALCGVI